MYGWTGTILEVNLTTGKTSKEPLDKELARSYLGGRGINSKILYDELEVGIDPLGPDNVLIFGTGPVTGTLVPGSGKWTVTAKSPLTGGLGDSCAGGHFGPELKYAGFDHIIVKGRSEKPVWLWIDDGDVELRNADDLWGCDTWKTQRIIKEKLGDSEVKVVTIGPAGENLVKIACIIHGLKRAAGRCGLGAVMGSKNLKAIAVRGTNGVKVAEPDKLEEVVKEANRRLKADTMWYKLFSVYGTTALVETFNEIGGLTVKNFQESGTYEDYMKISGETFVNEYSIKNLACFGCPLHCSHYYMVPSGPFECVGEGPEYVTLSSLGCKCLNSNLPSILYMNTLCNKLGLDTTGVGNTIAWVMECYERGIIRKEDVDGLSLEWGNYEVMIEMIERIAKKEGFGTILGEGSWGAAKRIGKGSEKWSMSIKGQDYGVTETRAFKGWALGYATSTRGADHLRTLPIAEWTFTPEQSEKVFGTDKAADRFSSEGKGYLVAWHENIRAVSNSMNICQFITRTSLLFPEDLAMLLSPVIGIDMDSKEIMTIGERIINVEKLINIREGITREHDILPHRVLYEPIKKGPSKGRLISPEEFNRMLDDYYNARSWDTNTGLPTKDKLKELGIV
ncbi:MAG: aldehyde ferredoxin oxidoreductase [Nitrososphaeria archaeon]|nr:aldehyde ferredoxin oxidoreductase [Nitrososphaeria archaeon]NIN51846.1 aldehyde ferredoxin oxidoreductase [Nitrososphaeria archaeon]NIQ32368.1 aldehyde ferredoxin oxidoreductase [Nitrososphaeria archaeon]